MNKNVATSNNLKERIDQLQMSLNSEENLKKQNLENKIGKQQVMEMVGKEVGISYHSITAICRDQFEPRLSTALRLAKYFNCSIEDIFTLK